VCLVPSVVDFTATGHPATQFPASPVDGSLGNTQS